MPIYESKLVNLIFGDKMSKSKEKSLGTAIGLNFLLAGAGYMYMGKWILGIMALFIIIAIYATFGGADIILVWIVMNLIMAIDMYILFKNNKDKLINETTKKCPNCAETIQKDAKICRYCNTSFETNEG